MKKSILFLLVVILGGSCSNDDKTQIPDHCNLVNFKYYEGKKDYLGNVSNDYLFLGIDTVYTDQQIKDFIATQKYFDKGCSYVIHSEGVRVKFKSIPIKLNTSKSCDEIAQIILDLQKESIISYANYTMISNSCIDLIGRKMGDLCVRVFGADFVVKIFKEEDIEVLNEMIAKTNTELVEKNSMMPNWYLLRVTKKSKGNAMEMANYFHESGLFQYAEPNVGVYSVE